MEIVDLFPTDHPYLNGKRNADLLTPKQNNKVSEMERKMQDLLKNTDGYNAYIFVFDLGEKRQDTYDGLLKVI